jgi:hypothetical protein
VKVKTRDDPVTCSLTVSPLFPFVNAQIMLEPDVDDVSSEDSSVVVDCDVLEAAKENVQPLVSGRRVTALSAILQTPHGLRETKLSATRNRLRINVDIALEDSEDDPLEAYCRLIYWTVENYPQGHSAESGLLELLEEATRKLKDDRDGQWRSELKYLKLWVLYASFVEKPVIIYKFLLANEIGTGWALFYEEYATALERNGMCVISFFVNNLTWMRLMFTGEKTLTLCTILVSPVKHHLWTV